MKNNLNYVQDVNNCTKDKEIIVLKNGGLLFFYRKGRLRFLPLRMHVNKNYLSTILSLKDVKNISGVRVTMYKLIEKAINMILSDGTVFKFKEC